MNFSEFKNNSTVLSVIMSKLFLLQMINNSKLWKPKRRPLTCNLPMLNTSFLKPVY